MPENNDNKKKQPATSQLNLLLRIIIGGYLLYLAWSMRSNFDQVLFIIAAIVFAAAGVGLVVWSVKRIFTGEFDYLDSQGNIIEPDELEDLDKELEELEADVSASAKRDEEER